MWLWAGLAFAGELYVTTSFPVHVWVDGNPVMFQPGTSSARFTGVSGVHRVQVAGADNVLQAETQVQVPWDGVRTVTWDGVGLVITAPAGPQVVMLPAPAPAPAPVPVGPTAMSQAAFSSLVAAVNSGSYSDDKLAAIRTAAAGNWFTIDQVGRLVDGLTYGSDQVTAVQICASKVVDPENAFALASHFTYSSDKESALALFQ